ncbi:hypothetical protein HY572_01645 [Candidatus Micrarchaeota archaeon]|nr:hypothetical protein [Candidatus Micrarchaeota archaeon]
MNLRFWKGVLGAWIAAVVILNIGNSVILMPTWLQLQAQGVVRAGDPLVPMAGFLVLLLAGIYIMCEFLEKLGRGQNVQPLKHGIQFGILLAIPDVIAWLFYNLPDVVPLVQVPFSIVGTAAAAWVYYKLDPAPIARGQENKQYLRARKKR